jgi:hypothetical protein
MLKEDYMEQRESRGTDGGYDLLTDREREIVRPGVGSDHQRLRRARIDGCRRGDCVQMSFRQFPPRERSIPAAPVFEA